MANGSDSRKPTEVRGTYLEFPTKDVPYRCRVYVPENPHQADRLLYLLHGNGDTENDWHNHETKFDIPREVEAMIAGGKIGPLAVVLPYSFLQEKQWPPLEGFERHLLNLSKSVENHLASTYSFRPRHRAIAGISMGGQLALYTGLGDPRRFSAIGAFSAAIQNEEKRNEIVERLLLRNTPLELFYLSCETQPRPGRDWTQQLIDANRGLEEKLKTRKIPHQFHWQEATHTWVQNWNVQLPSFLEALSNVWNVKQAGPEMKKPFGSAMEIMMTIVEELGDVSKEVSLIEKIGSKADGENQPSKERLTEEITQLLNAIFALANFYEIDLDKKYAEKPPKNIPGNS